MTMNLSDVKIREATIADTNLLANLGAKTFSDTFAHQNTEENMSAYLKETFTVEKISEDIKDISSIFLIAFENKEAIGYAKLKRNSTKKELQNSKAMEIERIYILQKAIGKGIGKLLMGKCFAIAVAEDFEAIWLGVSEHNHVAILFYKKFGFETFGSHIFKLGNDNQTDLLMKRALK